MGQGSTGRKRGRPPSDKTAAIWNPRFRRVRAALCVESYIYQAICELIGGTEPRQKVEARMRKRLLDLLPRFDPARLRSAVGEELRRFPISVADLVDGPQAYMQKVESFNLPTVQAMEHDPQRVAARLVGPLLGRGADWFRDLVRAIPKEWVGARRKHISDNIIAKRRKTHPGKYDFFTPSERCFYRLPQKAQEAIERAIYEWRHDIENLSDEQQDAIVYLDAPFECRVQNTPPELLKSLVRDAIEGLPDKLRKNVYRLLWRPLRAKHISANRKSPWTDVDPEVMAIFDDAQQMNAHRVGSKFVQAQAEEIDGRAIGSKTMPHYYLTPLPSLGPLPTRRLKTRRRS